MTHELPRGALDILTAPPRQVWGLKKNRGNNAIRGNKGLVTTMRVSTAARVPAGAARVSALFLALAFMLSRASAQNCRATYRPVSVDMTEEEWTEDGLTKHYVRASVDYVELSTLDASAVYVNPYGCALGADGEVTHRRPKRTLKLGCADMNDCPSDQEAFWRDPLRYACGETTDYDYGDAASDCKVEDPFTWGGQANVCCPLDKPNYYVFARNAGSGYGSSGRRRLMAASGEAETRPGAPKRAPGERKPPPTPITTRGQKRRAAHSGRRANATGEDDAQPSGPAARRSHRSGKHAPKRARAEKISDIVSGGARPKAKHHDEKHHAKRSNATSVGHETKTRRAHASRPKYANGKPLPEVRPARNAPPRADKKPQTKRPEPAGARRKLSEHEEDESYYEYYEGGGYYEGGDYYEDGDYYDFTGGWQEETLVGVCSAAELPALNQNSFGPVDWAGETFNVSDKVDFEAFGELGQMTMKALYRVYDQDASDMLQGLVYGYAEGCEADSMTFTMPPYEKDVVSNFFAHVYNSPVPGNDEIKSIRKVSPFSNAISRKNASGVCTMVVTLKENDVEGELVSIDGVDFSCLQSAYENVPDAYVALDAYTALAKATGSVPAVGDDVVVEIRNMTTGLTTTYEVTPTYTIYASLKSKLDTRNDEAMWGWGASAECGKMTYLRWEGRVAPGDLECARDASVSTSGRVADARETARESMLTSKIGFASFGEATRIKTGVESEMMNNPNPPNFDVEKGDVCKFAVWGLVDEYGDAVCAEPMTVQRVRDSCSFKNFSEIADDIVSVITQAQTKVTTSAETDYIVHTGKDDWVECMDIFRTSALLNGTKTVTRMTDDCVRELPDGAWDWWSLCNADWGSNPEDPYCQDPCCNYDLQSSMCCAAQEVSYDVPAPSFDFESFSYSCILSDLRSIISQGSDLAPNPALADALADARNIFDLTLHPEKCLQETDSVASVIAGIQEDLTCCLKAVVGEWDWNANKFVSNMPCDSTSACPYSGSCDVTSENTNPDPEGSCWPDRTAFTNGCAVASQAKAGAGIAMCLDNKLAEREKIAVAYGAAREALKVLLGGSKNATFAEIGEVIIEQSGYQSCEGPSGWMYNPDNTCQNYDWETGECGEQFCETAEECKTMCLADEGCNWGAEFWDPVTYEWRKRTRAECFTGKSPNFCAVTDDWGWVEDVTVPGACAYNGQVYERDGEWTWEHPDVDDAVCAAIDSNMTAIDSEWSWDGSKRCGFTTGAMATDADTCYEECTGTSGFKPPKILACYKEPVDGACDSDGWFTQLRDDPTVDWEGWPWEIPFPQVCMADFAGPGGKEEQAAAVDSNGYWWSSEAATTAEWTITLTTTDPDIDGSYDIRDAWSSSDAWAANVAGHTDWWYGLTFTSREIADAVCAELDARVIVQDDGSDSCAENRCWLEAKTTESECYSFTSSEEGFSYTDWRSAFDAGAGACFVQFDEWEDGFGWREGPDAIANKQTLCDTLGGTFYLGRRFKAGQMDDEGKCSGEYCSVLGPRFDARQAMCDSIGGVCTGSNGCYGCRAPEFYEYNDDYDSSASAVPAGMCYKSGITDEDACSATYVAEHDICVGDAGTKSDCGDSWLSCEDLEPEFCQDPDASEDDAGSVRAYAAAKLGCRLERALHQCKTQWQCEKESGTCWGRQLRDQVCSYDEETWEESCRIVANACKVPVDDPYSWVCPGSECEDDWGCWDPERDHFGTYCVDYVIASEAECTAADGEWLSTDVSSQAAFCENDKECTGGRSAWGNVWERDEEQCEMCGGNMMSWGQWQNGTWVEPEMVTGGREYKARAMEPLNTWSTRIDEWRVRDLVRDIETQLLADAQVAFAYCMYGTLGSSIESLASQCGGATLPEKLAEMTKTTTTVSTTLIPGDESPTEDASGNAVRDVDGVIASNSSDATVSVSLETGKTTPNVGSADSASSKKRRRALLQSGADSSVDEAGCWSKVRNGNDALVGQLLGDCVALRLSDNAELSGPIEICLATKTSREVASEYTVDGFAIRTVVDDDFVFTPASGLTVTAVGAKLCAGVQEVGTLYCPVKLAASWATASSDIGSTECEATAYLAELQAESLEKAYFRAELDAAEDEALAACAAGDQEACDQAEVMTSREDGEWGASARARAAELIAGLGEIGGIAVVAGACFMFCCGTCGCFALCLAHYRKRIDAAEEAKTKAKHATEN